MVLCQYVAKAILNNGLCEVYLKEWFKKRTGWFLKAPSEREYEECIADLISDEKVCSMNRFIQHGDTTTLEHSLSVSYFSYRFCRNFGLDYKAAARGGLLHDFFLYDWHEPKRYKGLHGLKHPGIALQNAEERFVLSLKEKDIIKKHMWPVTLSLPRFRESLVVIFADKLCAVLEVLDKKQAAARRLKTLFEY